MADTSKKKSPAAFVQEVRNEAKKVTWPSRKETGVSMIAVFAMVLVASLFLYVADQVIAWLIRLVL